MKCPHCNQEHPDSLIECPSTGKMLKRACTNKACSYFGEHIWPLEKETCPCCGQSLNTHYGHEFVDLGLSVKWATCNIGAKTPEEYGDYFAWGETSPKSNYEWYNLKYCNDNNGDSFSKYNISDNRTVLELNDDAAHVNWGGNWRMPTDSNFHELLDKCTLELTCMNNILGFKVTSKMNDKSIFFPFTEWHAATKWRDAGMHGYYWSSSLDVSHGNCHSAMYLFIQTSFHNNTGPICRRNGYLIRPVCP